MFYRRLETAKEDRIARELHADALQRLTNIVWVLEPKEIGLEKTKTVSRAVKEVDDSIRRAVHNLRARWVEQWNGSPNWEGWNFAEDDRCPQATPTPRPGPRPTSGNPDEQCPATNTTTTPPTTKVWFEPPYPVVIAQDPEDKGVDVHMQVTTYPVHYEWQEWEVVSTERKCRWKYPSLSTKCYNCKPGCECYVNSVPCDAGWYDWKWKTVDKYGYAWHNTWVPEGIIPLQ